MTDSVSFFNFIHLIKTFLLNFLQFYMVKSLLKLILKCLKFLLQFINKFLVIVQYLSLLYFIIVVQNFELFDKLIVPLTYACQEFYEILQNFSLFIILILSIISRFFNQLLLFIDIPGTKRLTLFRNNILNLFFIVIADVFQTINQVIKSIFVILFVQIICLLELQQEIIQNIIE